MAIKVVEVRCPGCNAELNIEEGREFAFCSYCGTKVVLNNENEFIYRNIDEARIKEAETERMIRLKEMEMEEKEKKHSKIGPIIAYVIAIICGIIAVCSFTTTEMGSLLIGLVGGIIAMYAFVFTMDSGSKKGKKRVYVGPNETKITCAMADFKGKNIKEIYMLYQIAGFTNIKVIALDDLNVFTMNKNGQVENITINGDDDFDEEDIFPKESIVMMTYHGNVNL